MKNKIYYTIIVAVLIVNYSYTQKMVKVQPEVDHISPFLIDETETTMADFQDFVDETGYQTTCELKGFGGVYGKEGENVKTKGINWRHDPYGSLIDKKDYEYLPVARVSLIDILAYAKWKNKRLPTTEEWMIAAQAGKKHGKFIFAGSNSLNAVGWFSKNVKNTEQGFFAVKKKNPNEIGAYDMSGNAEELTCKTTQCDTVIRKGGRYISDKEMAKINSNYSMKITNKEFNSPFIGFRLVKDID
ncbi:MAG: SUMF1/EgtB/PvdO family nonheme iron enzyme [Bacteroidota bacterium]